MVKLVSVNIVMLKVKDPIINVKGKHTVYANLLCVSVRVTVAAVTNKP